MNKGKKQAGKAMRRRENGEIRRSLRAGVNPFCIDAGHLMRRINGGYLVFAK